MTYREMTSHNHITESLTKKAKRVIDCLERNVSRNELLQYSGQLADAVEQLWREVRQGDCRVESIALLRVMRQTTCRDILSTSYFSRKSPKELVSQLKLFVNTVRYVLKPATLPS
ncbi:MAG: hypothetical protein ACOC38_07205 [Promethearchaeia archaeon]